MQNFKVRRSYSSPRPRHVVRAAIRDKAKLRASRTSAAELRVYRTSALRRGCMTATIGTPPSDHLSVSEHPFSRNLLRQNASRAFNAVAPTIWRRINSKQELKDIQQQHMSLASFGV
ncbi:hypothetical protein SLEP1_g60261, partial [Rubroshorea leprosula]